jgi:hypothetical protein
VRLGLRETIIGLVVVIVHIRHLRGVMYFPAAHTAVLDAYISCNQKGSAEVHITILDKGQIGYSIINGWTILWVII